MHQLVQLLRRAREAAFHRHEPPVIVAVDAPRRRLRLLLCVRLAAALLLPFTLQRLRTRDLHTPKGVDVHPHMGSTCLLQRVDGFLICSDHHTARPRILLRLRIEFDAKRALSMRVAARCLHCGIAVVCLRRCRDNLQHLVQDGCQCLLVLHEGLAASMMGKCAQQWLPRLVCHVGQQP